MALIVTDILCTTTRPLSVVVTFNEAVLQVNPSNLNDALRLANYSILDTETSEEIEIIAVHSFGSRAVELAVATPLVIGEDRYSLDVVRVEATNGDVIVGDGLHIIEAGGIASDSHLGFPIITTVAPDITAFFTTAATADLVGVATDTGGKVWSEASVFSVDAGHKLKHVAAGAGAPNVCYFDAGILDHTLEMKIDTLPPSNTDFGFLCQYDVAGSNWFIVYWSGVDKWAIAKVSAGVWPPLLVSLSGPDSYSIGDVMKVVCSPTAITLFVNGVQKVQYRGPNFAPLGTGVGWYIGPFNAGDPTGQGRFNHFTVRQTPITTYVSDTFTRADNPVLPGNADTGQPWVVDGGGSWGIQSNSLYCTSSGDDTITVDAGIADVVMEFTCLDTSMLSFGIASRLTDHNNYILCNFWTGDGGFRFYKVESGVLTALAAAIPLATITAGDVFRLVCSGNNFSLFRNNVFKGSAVSNFNIAATKFGFRGTSDATANHFDNFTVKA